MGDRASPAKWSAGALIAIGLLAVAPPATAATRKGAVVHPVPSRLPDWSGVWVLTQASLGQALRDSLGGPTPAGATPVPLKPRLEDVRKAETLARRLGKPAPGNLVQCLPAGMPGLMQHPMMYEFLFTSGRVTMLFEDGEVRRIYTDGRSHPQGDDAFPSYSGHSIGRWDGGVLVVDTVQISNQSDIFLNSSIRTTDKTHLVERISMRADQHIQIDTVMTDEDLLTSDYKYSRIYEKSPLPIGDPSCEQNNRDTDQQVELAPPPEHH